MSEKITVAEFKSDTKHIQLLQEIKELDEIFFMQIHEVEVKYPETYADETKRGVIIESRAFGCKHPHVSVDGYDGSAELTAKRHFVEWVKKSLD